MKKYEITEEQIKDIAKGGGKTKIKEMFPEAFETKPEVGKWYRIQNLQKFLICFNGTLGNFAGYGFDMNGLWCDTLGLHSNDKCILATESEVFEALKKEAVKRGFVDGVKYESPIIKNTNICNGIFSLSYDFKALYSGGVAIFNAGKWAEIIKETPEDFLNEIFKADLICKTDKEKYPNSVFYFQGDTLLLEIEKTPVNLHAWVNYNKIWNPISTKFGLNYSEIQQVLKVRIEDHFKLRDVTPDMQLLKYKVKIEDHFKLRDVTPTEKKII